MGRRLLMLQIDVGYRVVHVPRVRSLALAFNAHAYPIYGPPHRLRRPIAYFFGLSPSSRIP